MSIEGAFPKFPITIPSRCSPRLFCTDYARPRYTFDMSSRPCGSAIQFQLTYTSDRYVTEFDSYTFYIKQINQQLH